ncbi:MAG TPA: succinylglutamate desuccinylase/aspartoacylase family protein [Oligoflexus sp.]|uniref:succinylglutamate desuccinylase/aspartoacylase family protein n=1 Tax=Oligoflexus sp. TaxID=1971216 RepID=UPI002D704B8E|nr:succinylglutamate desuccinylase/aspartoacylase family protein [Oligoflexus sp.]HYX35854.1 succinylglutamate desuccinylase/aspartoacylase family protein [Oligoflexus sp.]
MSENGSADDIPPETTPFVISGHTIKRGERKKIHLKIGKLYDNTDINIPVEVIRGKLDGPTLFVSAAVHGDELNGVEICKRLLDLRQLKEISGTLLVIPIVNVFGFNNLSRYLPDRRDLNRSFPGSPNGSLASRLAHVFMTEIVSKATHGIDLHTGAVHRRNLAQIRADIDHEETLELAEAFGIPVIIKSNVRDGSLRQAVLERDLPMLLFEGGEALRFDDRVIKVALDGIISVMYRIAMLDPQKMPPRLAQGQKKPFIAKSSYWIRATRSGIIRLLARIGKHVHKDEVIGIISDPYGDEIETVRTRVEGIVICASMLPVVHEGDALFHIATFHEPEKVEESLADLDELAL